MSTLTCNFAGVEFPSPLVVASGPLTNAFSKVAEAHRHGAGGVSLKLTFVEVPFPSQMRSYSLPGHVLMSPTNRRLSLKEGVALAEMVKKELPIVVMANVSAGAAAYDDWKMLAESFQEAGVDMLEPNFCCPNLDTSLPSEDPRAVHGGMLLGEDPDVAARIVDVLKSTCDVPVVPKIMVPSLRGLVTTARAMVDAGCDGIHVVGLPAAGLPPLNEKGVPEIPLLEGVSPGSTNGPLCKYNTFLCTAVLADAVDVPLMASGGLGDWKDCVDVVRWGATLPSVCSVLMWYGWKKLDDITRGMEAFLSRSGAASLGELRGTALKHLTTPDKVTIIDGVAEVDKRKCTGCGRCTMPAHCEAVVLGADGKAVVDATACIGCGVCVSLCPVGAIAFRRL